MRCSLNHLFRQIVEPAHERLPAVSKWQQDVCQWLGIVLRIPRRLVRSVPRYQHLCARDQLIEAFRHEGLYVQKVPRLFLH